jgi:hypothetical protein
MRIAFIHQGLAALPELEAYARFFNSRGQETFIIKKGESPLLNVDVEWHLMGLGGRRIFSNSILIHEYASASVPEFAAAKDLCKRWFNSTPDFRIYLNQSVRKALGFNDDIPFGFRDMGINFDAIREDADLGKTFDFIYPGSVQPYHQFRKLLSKFAVGDLKDRSLLVISDLDRNKRSDWAAYPNIEFRDRMPNAAVLQLIKQARFGINFRPAVRPYTFQTSTKLLEYAACRVPIITSPSEWLKSFQNEYGGNYFILSGDLANLNSDNLQRFDFTFPSVESFSWDQQIMRSGVFEFLKMPLNES